MSIRRLSTAQTGGSRPKTEAPHDQNMSNASNPTNSAPRPAEDMLSGSADRASLESTSSLDLTPSTPDSMESLLTDDLTLRSLRVDGIAEEDFIGARILTRSMTNLSVTGNGPAQGAEQPPLQRRRSTVTSTIQNITRKFGYWDSEFHAQRINIIVTMLTNYVFLIVGFLIALCIYWGAYYDRSSRYKNVHFGVMIADDGLVGEMTSRFFALPALKAAGDFHVWNASSIQATTSKLGMSAYDFMRHEVHREKYRAAYFVKPNATTELALALNSLNTSFNPANDLLMAYYETGSDYNGVNNYFSSMVQLVVASHASFMEQVPWAAAVLQMVNSSHAETILDRAPELLTSLPQFRIVDGIPVIPQVIQAPLQVGLIYLCIFTFFQFVFSAPIHMYMSSKLKGLRYVAYRITAAQLAYIGLGFAYVLLNTAFQVSFTKAFGHLGFLVIWAFAYLTMSSIGSLIEMMVLVCIATKPAMIGLVLLLVAVTNLAPTISPIVLCPTFYRYGYALPVFNSYQLMMVAFFDAYKGHMGRNIGILVAWIIITNSGMPFVMGWTAKKMAQKAAAAKEKTA